MLKKYACEQVQVQGRAPRIVKEIERLSYKERIKELVLLSLAKSQLWRHMIAVCEHFRKDKYQTRRIIDVKGQTDTGSNE